MKEFKEFPLDTKYLVSSDGSCLKHKTKGVLSSFVRKDGYVSVSISRKSWLMHRVVGITYLENPNNLPQINHKNGIKTDNRPCNLEWCDQSHNQKHRFTHLGHKGPKNENYPTGKHHHNSKAVILFKPETGEELRFNTVTDAARYFGLKSPSSVSNVLVGRSNYVNGFKARYAYD